MWRKSYYHKKLGKFPLIVGQVRYKVRHNAGFYSYRARCRKCGKVKADKNMIYVVPEDRYYCNQQCMDAYNAIKRDKKGFVING